MQQLKPQDLLYTEEKVGAAGFGLFVVIMQIQHALGT